MTTETKAFKVSARLKDLIGRELITDDFVAVFELVKNSFDAHATSVQLLFEPGLIAIADNGKGMSRDAIIHRWLFVAYSAKRDGSEDADYRHRLSARPRRFAGDKGIGRFSCDSLGKHLTLHSRAESHPVQVVALDWTKYEQDSKREFHRIPVQITESEDFAEGPLAPEGDTGTVLKITGLRHVWPREKLLDLRRGLARLINPFDSADSDFRISLVAPAEVVVDQRKRIPTEIVNGPIENTLLDVLKGKTTTIRVSTSPSDGWIDTTLEDRGDVIYRVREQNPYEDIRDCAIRADIYYLNRSAKKTFHHRMGLRSVDFGSVFVFRNGFRMFPIGEEYDDFFGLARRKQQGTRRYLGTRDIIGRVDVPGGRGFVEATSRDQGLVRTPEVEALSRFVIAKCIKRLEKYVVDVTWPDSDDQEYDDTSRMELADNRSRIRELIVGLAANREVEILDYNRRLVEILEEKSRSFESAIGALDLLSTAEADPKFRKRVAVARSLLREWRVARDEAVEKAMRVERTLETERKRNRFLVAAQSLDADTIVNLHHQIMGHASDVHDVVEHMMGRLRDGSTVEAEEWVDVLDTVSFRNSQILTAAKFATKGGYREHATELSGDLADYIEDYVETVAALWTPLGVRVECRREGGKLERSFRPIDVGILIDNLVSNAEKAQATRIVFVLRPPLTLTHGIGIAIADDGNGWSTEMEPVSRVFEKGVTTTDGSGLGLYHVQQVVEAMDGVVKAHGQRYSREFGGAHLTIEVGP